MKMPQLVTVLGLALTSILSVLAGPTVIAAGAQAARAAKASDVTVIGCVQFEKDYRKIHNEGKGGVLGTGIGETDQFVLVDAVMAPKNVDKSPVETSGMKTTTYALTGHLEKELAESVNRQVEVVGTITKGKAGNSSAAKDPGDLPKLEVTLWHTVTDFCPSKKK